MSTKLKRQARAVDHCEMCGQLIRFKGHFSSIQINGSIHAIETPAGVITVCGDCKKQHAQTALETWASQRETKRRAARLDGVWIMLIKKLPTRPSPPKLSIHWATLWVDEKQAKEQRDQMRLEHADDPVWLADHADDLVDFQTYDRIVSDNTPFGLEHNYNGARQIIYKDEAIRVFPDEFNIMTPEKMRLYIFGDSCDGTPPELPSHDLVANSEADKLLLQTALDTDLRSTYDAALVDGATPPMALALTMGVDITDLAIEFPPVGWYRCKEGYGLFFCSAYELTED